MNTKKIIWIVIAVLAVLLTAYGCYYIYKPKPEAISYNEFLEAMENQKIEKVFLNDEDKIEGIYKDGSNFVTDNPRKEGFKEELLKNNVQVDEMRQRMRIESFLNMILTIALFVGLIIFLSKRTSKQTQNGMGKVSALSVEPNDKTNITFQDVAGNEEAKESIKELVDFIKNPEKYAKYGAHLPRGVIFYGPPGTGKTLMAKAVAGEADVPFYAVSGSDFVQVYVGVGAGRIRDLFKKARKNRKCVIFIDEIDALGKKREGGLDGGGNDERDQTLNALLAEMSGFNENDGIVVIAATNRLDTLDEALLRPGRFDRHIEIGLPDVKARLEILKLHSRNKPLSPSVDLQMVAQQTVYFSGAKIENMMNEAAIIAAKRKGDSIDQSDIDKAFYLVVAGAEKKDKSGIADIDRRITAFHEAGHALVTKLIAPEYKVSRVTIIPSTKGIGGFSMSIPPDRMYFRKKDMENSIKITLGGRAAEEVIFGTENITSGAANDIEKATEIIVNMIRRFGMNVKTGMLNYDILYKNGIKQADDVIINECKQCMESLYNNVKALIDSEKKLLKRIAFTLLEKETLNEQELDEIIMSKSQECA